MLILGLETSTSQVSVAIGGPDGVTASARVRRDQRHAELLAPLVEQMLRSTSTRLADLAAVAVGDGPGLYTGLRVGVATAKTLALALDLPVVPVCSLDLLAHAARHGAGRVAAVMDARRSEVFWAVYETDRRGVRTVVEPAVGRPDAAAERLGAIAADAGPVRIVGDGALRHAAPFLPVGGDVAADWPAYPSASALVQIAVQRLDLGGGVAQDAVVPRYLRRPDAEANWVERGPA